MTFLGLFAGTLGQGEFTDRSDRKAVYQFNLLLYGVATILAACRRSRALSGSSPASPGC
jgi:MFS family permease